MYRSHQHLAEIRRGMELREGVDLQTNPPNQGRRWITELISRTEGTIQN
jgi:hypothetical protein